MSDVDANSDSRARAGKWVDRALWAAVIAACALTLSQHLADPDFWGHVQYGRDALNDGLPSTSTYSYTAEGHRWINHENLSEVLFAVGVDSIGPGGLLAVKCLLGLAVLGLIIRSGRRRGASQLTSFAVALLTSTNLMLFWSMRPQLFSCTLFALLVALLDWCFQGWEGRWRPLLVRSWSGQQGLSSEECSGSRLGWLWGAPALFAVWANTHGAFVAGYFLFAAYLACRGVEALARGGRAAWGLTAQLGAVGVASGLATALNPYGFGLHRWLAWDLSVPRPEIVEWLPPELHVVWLPFWLMAAIWLAALAASRRPKDCAHIVLFCLTLWQALEHRRHIPFFAILFGFWMPGHCQSLLERIGAVRSRRLLGPDRSPAMQFALAAILCAASVLAAGRLYGQLRRIPVRRDIYPVSAMQYMADQGLAGKLVVSFAWSQYAIVAFGARSPGDEGCTVAFDGRFRTGYPQEVADLQFDFEVGDLGEKRRFRSPQSPPVEGGRVLEHRRPDLVLLERSLLHARAVMHRHRDAWVLLYQDGLAQLWGRASKYGDPESVHHIPPARRRISEEPQVGVVAWPALPVRGRSQQQLAIR